MRSNATSETSSTPNLTTRLLRLSATQDSDAPAPPPLPAVHVGLQSVPRADSVTPAAASLGVGDQSSTGVRADVTASPDTKVACLEADLAIIRRQLEESSMAEGIRLATACARERANFDQRIQALLTDHCAELQAAAQREHNLAEEHEHCLRQYEADRDAMLADLEGTRIECQRLAALVSEHEAARHATEQGREDVRCGPQEATRHDHDPSMAEREATQAELERTRVDRERLDAAYRDLQLAHQLAAASWCAEREAFEDRHNTLVARYEAALHIAHQSVDQLRTVVMRYRGPHERI